MKLTFLKFTEGVMGYTFHNKRTGQQVYRWELYWSGYTIAKCFEKFEVRNIKRQSYE